MREILNRKALVHELAIKAANENLGLFVGTGFSIAMNAKTCNFRDLVSYIYNTPMPNDEEPPNFDKDRKEKPDLFLGKSFPQIVEDIEKEKGRDVVCSVVVQRCSINISDELLFKNQKNKPTEEENVEFVRRSLSLIAPQWAITTNYDLVLEQLLENSETFGPKDFVSIHFGVTPIFHIHGHVKDPENIVISEKDYSNFLSSNLYRQQKLSSLLAESTVLFMGYSLGDINVRSALERAKQFFPEKREQEDRNLHVLLSYKKDSLDEETDSVVYDKNIGLYVLEVNSLKKFIRNVGDEVKQLKACESDKIENIQLRKNEIKCSEEYRKSLICQLNNCSKKLLKEICNVLLCVIDGLWNEYSKFYERKISQGLKELYEKNIIDIVVDLIYSENVLLLNPALIYKIIGILNRLAQDNCKFLNLIEKQKIPRCVYKEITNIIESNNYLDLRKVFEQQH